VLPAGSTRAADDRRRTGGGGALAVRAVNLIPVKVRRGSPGKSGSGVYMLLGGLGALVLAVAAFVFVSNSVTSRQGRSRPPDDRRPTRRRRRRRPLKPYLDFANLRQKRVATIQALAQSRFPWERSMRQIARVIPSNVWLTHFIGTVAPGVTLEEVNGGDTSTLRNGVQAPAIQLIGCTYDHSEVSRLMARLRA
jgi:Tfp pilus assembly protein PilN